MPLKAGAKIKSLLILSSRYIFLTGFVLSIVLNREAFSAGETEYRQNIKSIREFGVSADSNAVQNARNLQKAIDQASESGAALFVEPTSEPYYIAGGIILKQNVSLIGVNGPVGRGTRHPVKQQPVGSVFAIEDEKRPFLTVENATQIRGIQFCNRLLKAIA
jgi:polygalacturonase